MSNSTPPPMKRLRLTLTLDVHSLHELALHLDQIATDIEQEGREERDVTSGNGYYYSLTVRDGTMTPERYERELVAWHAERQAARRAASAEPAGAGS